MGCAISDVSGYLNFSLGTGWAPTSSVPHADLDAHPGQAQPLPRSNRPSRWHPHTSERARCRAICYAVTPEQHSNCASSLFAKSCGSGLPPLPDPPCTIGLTRPVDRDPPSAPQTVRSAVPLFGHRPPAALLDRKRCLCVDGQHGSARPICAHGLLSQVRTLSLYLLNSPQKSGSLTAQRTGRQQLTCEKRLQF